MTAKSKKITMANTNAIKPLEIADVETLVQAREEYAMAVACVKKQREEEKKFAHKEFVQKLPDNYRPPLIGRFTKQHRHAFTRTKKTEVQYMKRARSLTKRFECDPAVNGRSDEDAFFMWILIRKQLIKTSTWKGDRSALLYFFSSTSYLHALILNTNNVGGKDQNRKRLGLKKMTSGKKIKYIPEKDRTKLFNSLRNTSGGYWHDVGVMIFSVMYFTGIRPIEITQSTVINIHNDAGKLVSALRVKNAKNTNGRGNGEFRTIPLDKHNEDFINGIRQFLESASFPRLANGHSTTPENYVKKASEAFGKHIRKIFPKRKNHICLYSARHQFAADAKRSGIRQTEVAALLGHACDRTAYIHYAKSSRSSSTKRIPKALRSEVATVRKKLSKAFLKNKKTSTNRPSFPTMGR